MEIKETINFLTDFRKNTKSSKNRKYSEKFVRLLYEIDGKINDQNQRERVKTELKIIVDNFHIEKDNVKVKKELNKFIQFLKSEFKMTTPYYYTLIGALIGSILSMNFGFFSLFFGLFIGAALGYYFDEKAKKEGRKLNSDLNEFVY